MSTSGDSAEQKLRISKGEAWACVWEEWAVLFALCIVCVPESSGKCNFRPEDKVYEKWVIDNIAYCSAFSGSTIQDTLFFQSCSWYYSLPFALCSLSCKVVSSCVHSNLRAHPFSRSCSLDYIADWYIYNFFLTYFLSTKGERSPGRILWSDKLLNLEATIGRKE